MDPFEHMQKHSQDLHLTHAERVFMRTKLEAHLRANPFLVSTFSWLRFTHPAFRSGAYAFALLVVGGGGAFAAENSIPGDVFYPLKIDVVEPIAGVLQMSDAAQTEWQVKLADRRLSEADQFFSSDDHTAEKDIEVAARVARSTTEAAKSVEEFSIKDQKMAAKAALSLDESLVKYGSTLRTLEESGDAVSAPVLRAAADTSGIQSPLPTDRVRAKVGSESIQMATFTLELPSSDVSDSDEEEYKKASRLFKRARAIAEEARQEDQRRQDKRERSGN